KVKNKNSESHLFSQSKIILHPTFKEPFGIAVAEGVSSGLIPVVPTMGGNSEFVPQRFQFGQILIEELKISMVQVLIRSY
ncbi:MAG: glycosyltransferase, partial [Nitrososphaerales archaeon]